MDPLVLQVLLTPVAMAVSLAAAAGIRAWLPLLVVGLLARAGVVELVAPFTLLTLTPVLVVLAVATILEIVGDKIPVVDHAIDVVSTVLRPVAGALVSATVVAPFADPLLALLFGTAVGAPVAFVPHAVKSGTRAVSTTTTAGLANPFVSIAEDIAAIVIIALAIVLPVLAAFVALVAAVVIVRWWWRRRQRRLDQTV